LYTENPIFVGKQNKGETSPQNKKKDRFDKATFEQLLNFCLKNYNLKNIFFVFHPNSDARILELVNKFEIKYILLDSNNRLVASQSIED